LEKSPEFYDEEGLENLRVVVADEDPEEDDVGYRDTTFLPVYSYNTPYEETLESKGGVTVRLRVTQFDL